jgi:hypothetical protein
MKLKNRTYLNLHLLKKDKIVKQILDNLLMLNNLLKIIKEFLNV